MTDFNFPEKKYIVDFFKFLLFNSLLQFFQFVGGVWVIESLYFEVSKLIWTTFTLLMTLFRLKSSFFCMVWVFFPMVGRILLERLYEANPAEKKTRGESINS